MSIDKAQNDTRPTDKNVITQHVVASKQRFSLSKRAKRWIGGGLIVVLAFAGFVTYSVFTNIESDAASCTSKTLSAGANSSCVKYAQQLLNGISEYFSAIPGDTAALSASSVSANGKYASSTTARVKQFQTYSGLKASGTIDKNTWYQLCSYTKSAYTSYSTNLRTNAVQSARTAYTKVSCGAVSLDNDGSQDSAAIKNTDENNVQDDTETQPNPDSSAAPNGTGSDTSAQQIVDNDNGTTSGKLTIVTWNIAGGSGGFDSKQRLTGLNEINGPADIISLQESHVASFRKQLLNTYLCTKCSNGTDSIMAGVELKNMPDGTNIYSSNSSLPASMPIFWKRDRLSLEGYGAYTALANSYYDENKDRVSRKWITWVKLHDKQTNRSFYVLNLHTPTNVENQGNVRTNMKKRNATYTYQMQLLAKVINDNFSSENLPIFVTGDFNVDYRTDKLVKHKTYPYAVMANLNFTSNWAFADADGSLPDDGSGKGSRLIDYVFIKRGVGMNFDETFINNNMYGSDHHPVFATIDISSN